MAAGSGIRGVFVNAREQRKVAAGDRIFTTGDSGAEMFGIVSGVVELTADGPTADGPTADGPTADGHRADGPTADGPTADGHRADGHRVLTLGEGDTFGELAIVSDVPRSLTATATTDTVLAVIDERTFLFLVHETPTFALQVMRSLADTVRAHDAR